MTDNKPLIMVVDDLDMNLTLIEGMLEDRYDIQLVSAGKDCIESMQQGRIPDLIILDVMMPEMDGFQVCHRLKANPDTRQIPIIFVTADDNADTKLRAFDAGGDGFIKRPISEDELVAKVEENLQRLTAMKNLESMADMSQKAAMQAMITTSEMGMLIQFMEYSGQITSYEELGERLTEVANNFGVRAVFQFVALDDMVNIGCKEDSLEAKLMVVARSKARIFGEGRRVFFNQESVSMLVKNMPVDDEALCGRLRDHFAVLMNASESVVRMIKYEDAAELQRRQNILEAADVCEVMMLEVGEKITGYGKKTADVLERIHDEFNDRLFSLGLSEQQEAQLLALFNDGHQQMEGILQEKGETIKALNRVTEAMRKLAE